MNTIAIRKDFLPANNETVEPLEYERVKLVIEKIANSIQNSISYPNSGNSKLHCKTMMPYQRKNKTVKEIELLELPFSLV